MMNPSNVMPVANYSIVQPATQQKTFSQNNIIRFSVPSNSVPFFDPHSSYLSIEAQLTAPTDKMELNGDASVIIEYIKISVNGVVLEEIDEYNQLANVWNTYGNDQSSRQVSSVFTQDSIDPFSGGLQGADTDGSINIKPVKLLIPLHATAIFGSKEVVPLMAFGANLDIEIRLAPNEKVLKSYQRGSYGASQNLDNNTTRILGGTIATATVDTFNINSEQRVGWSNIGDCPLAEGQHIRIRRSDGSQVDGANFDDLVIESITRVATTAITDNPMAVQIKTTAGAANTGGVSNNSVITKFKDTANAVAPTSGIIYQRAELYLQKVIPPSNYVKALNKSIMSQEGFQYDLHTFTTYKGVVKKEIMSQTIEIPAYQSRAKSVLTVMRRSGQAPVLNIDNTAVASHYRFNGIFQNCKDYQYQINNGIRVPTRPVNLDVMRGSFNHLSAEHLIQLTQALGSSNIGVKSIKDSRENFVIGRQLSKYGGTTNLTSALRIYVNYNAPTDPVADIQTITFVNHINRVAINQGGLQVFN